MNRLYRIIYQKRSHKILYYILFYYFIFCFIICILFMIFWDFFIIKKNCFFLTFQSEVFSKIYLQKHNFVIPCFFSFCFIFFEEKVNGFHAAFTFCIFFASRGHWAFFVPQFWTAIIFVADLWTHFLSSSQHFAHQTKWISRRRGVALFLDAKSQK